MHTKRAWLSHQRYQHLCTSYENISQTSPLQWFNLQNKARLKRYCKENDDPNGPPDKKKKFKYINCYCNTAYRKHFIGKNKPLSLQNSCSQNSSSGKYCIYCSKFVLHLYSSYHEPQQRFIVGTNKKQVWPTKQNHPKTSLNFPRQ